MSKITYKELIIEVLKEAKKPLSVSEIWEKACEMGLEKRLSSIGQTPTQTLWNRFFVNRDDFIKATQKPITFWLRSRQNELINLNLSEEKEVRLEKTKFNERDLHPLLVKFLYENLDFRLNSKTIYHEKSKKSENGKDKWNYPDIVGVYFPYDDYQNETLGLLESLKLNNYKIFSFELKININFSNLKESYFQAVSN
ncbi:TPA: HrgA protein, partial [Campylobacter upsaliensis]|nr:HrgA protein [Campylobacter upsaliensis]